MANLCTPCFAGNIRGCGKQLLLGCQFVCPVDLRLNLLDLACTFVFSECISTARAPGLQHGCSRARSQASWTCKTDPLAVRSRLVGSTSTRSQRSKVSALLARFLADRGLIVAGCLHSSSCCRLNMHQIIQVQPGSGAQVPSFLLLGNRQYRNA